ncbi:MAG: glycosyltransferase [Fodinibius sp.]|nr:glycosyltransferase [Fodinibius sp.]
MEEQEPHVLIIGFVWPEPRSSAAGRRMMELISLFQQQDWEVTFASAAAKTPHMENLEERGVATETIAINSSGFDEFIQDLQPDIVLFDRFLTEEQFGWRVAEQCPQALRILDTEDLHCLRRARKNAVYKGQQFSKDDLLEMKDAKREIGSIYRSDLTLMISEFEMQLLEDTFSVGAELLHYLPFMLDPVSRQVKQQWPGFEHREHFVTIGNFRHDPNADSVEYLYTEIWPRIREQLPQAELHIYGAYPGQRVEQLHSPAQGFCVKGRAEDARAVVRRSRVCLAPLRFGAGLKGKLVEAMQCGTPSVTTPIGAEGIIGDGAWAGDIVTESSKIVEAAVALYTNRDRWEKAQDRGVEIINNRFAEPPFGDMLINRICNLRMNLKEHRRQNFTGQMLMHHKSAGTKYMSLWIEEKNS